MAKGIRINQLAKELGVPSKSILDKCREEGLGERVPNHMSVVAVGLAETIKEWFSSGGGGTAVEIAAPVDVAVKTKPVRTHRRKQEELAEEAPSAEESTIAEAAPKPIRPVRFKPAVTEGPAIEAPVQPPPIVDAPVQQTPDVVHAAPIEPVGDGALAAEAPATTAPEAPKAKVVGEAPKTAPAKVTPGPRPTVTLQSRQQRQPVTPAPKLQTPAPAVIQGPNIVRVEAPEHVSAPRPRRPIESGPPQTQTARPGVGRGVKSTTTEEDEEAEKKKALKKGTSLSSRRRGVDGRRGEAMEKLREFTDADLLERQERLAAAASYRTGFDSHLKKSEQRGQHAIAKSITQRGEPVTMQEPITVRTFSSALGVKSSEIIGRLMKQGVFATINQALDRETAETMALEYGLELRIAQEESLEDLLLKEIEAGNAEKAADKLLPRPPVVTILGHVDHGKTSLLDKIRNANVAAGEAGGITQHTAAWVVELGKDGTTKRVTFIDTPGHQAFTAMRARGANMTDIVVLVVSAAEGVQPQTIESINHARAAEVPIVVALNKIDRADANPDMVLGQLAQQGLNPVEWGGDTEVVRTSATTGVGIEELIETLHYQAELLELKADPTAPAVGAVIESRVDPGLGAVATVLIQDGTLHLGDVALSGAGFGRVRSLLNDRLEMIESAGPATPVIVSGLSVLPSSGDKFYALDDFERARMIAEERAARSRKDQLGQQNKVTLENLFEQMKAGDVKTINLIVKGDVQGSVETLSKTVTDQNTDEVKIRVIHAAVGPITESDVELADASNAVIIGFSVVPDESARAMAEQRRVEVRTYRVIYEIFDDLKKALSGLLEPEIREKLHGHAEVRQLFKVSRLGNIAGCMVTDGHISRGSKIRLIREGRVVTEDLTIDSLKRVKDDVKEVKQGFECGIKLHGYDDIKIDDRFEAYVRETIQRTL